MNREQIGCGAIVRFGPNVRVSARIDQLGVDAKTIPRALDRPLHDVSNAQLLSNFAQISFVPGFVLAHTRVANHFQIGNPREIGQDLVLHAIREIRVVAIVTQRREGKNGDRFISISRRTFARSSVTAEKKERDRERGGNENDINPRTMNRVRFVKIDIFRAFESLRRDLKGPSARERNWKPDDDQYDN